MTLKVGALATSDERTKEFWRSAFDANGVLVTERTGQLWDAIIPEHARNNRGQGRCIAIIDGRFDPSWIPEDRIHPASQVRARAAAVAEPPHGTVVTLLALTAAPMAQVLLIDAVDRHGSPREDLVAKAIRHAAKNDADIINLSMELETKSQLRDSTWIDASLEGILDPDPQAFLNQIGLWIEHGEPYSTLRCPEPCMVCDALLDLPATTLVVAAAGNRNQAACPASFRGVVGVGFHRTVQTVVGEAVALKPLPTSTEQDSSNGLLYEVTVEEPPGFEGTSFASPMLSGLASLLQHPADVGRIASLSFAVAPLAAQMRLFLASEPSSTPERSGRTLLSGLLKVMDAIPDSHRHWEIGKTVVPCPLCSTVLAEWYNALAAVAGRVAIPEALGVAIFAAGVSPVSAAAAGNLAAVWLRLALEEDGTARRELLSAAEHSYTVAMLYADNQEVEDFFAQKRNAVRGLLGV